MQPPPSAIPSPAATSPSAKPLQQIVTVELPRAIVEGVLAQAIEGYISTAKVLRFNHEHAQWDLMLGHLLTQAGASDIIHRCATALAQQDSIKPS